MKKLLTILGVLLLLPSFASAKAAKQGLIPEQSAVFIAPMENGMDQFITAEMINQKVPVSLVLNEASADYILAGTAVKREGSHKWYNFLTGTAGMTDSVQTSISLVSKKEKKIVWAGNAGDRSVMFGIMKKGGERKTALRIVRKFKSDVF